MSHPFGKIYPHAPDGEPRNRYVAEPTFSFNNRELTDYERMVTVTASVAGKRLTYAEVKELGVTVWHECTRQGKAEETHVSRNRNQTHTGGSPIERARTRVRQYS